MVFALLLIPIAAVIIKTMRSVGKEAKVAAADQAANDAWATAHKREKAYGRK